MSDMSESEETVTDGDAGEPQQETILDAHGQEYVIERPPPAGQTQRSLSADLDRLIKGNSSEDDVDGLLSVQTRLDELSKIGKKKFKNDKGLYDDASSSSLSELFNPLPLDVIANVAKDGEAFPFGSVRK